jgi:hypothetical protein
LRTAGDSTGAVVSEVAGVSGLGVTLTISGDGEAVTDAMGRGILEKVSMYPLISDLYCIGEANEFTLRG